MSIKEKIVSNWKQVLKTYSFVFHVVAALVTLIDVVLPYMSLIEPTMDHQTYGVLMFVLNVAGGIGRLIKQPKVFGDVPVVERQASFDNGSGNSPAVDRASVCEPLCEQQGHESRGASGEPQGCHKRA